MNTITCGLLPGDSAPVVERLNAPLRAHLERQLGRRVKLVIGHNYVATGEGLRRGELDLAFLGPVTYVLQSRGSAMEPFARPTHGGPVGPTFRAVVIVPADSPVQSLDELRNAEIAMGDLASTSATWVPRHMLLSAGMRDGRDYVRLHLRGHDAVADAVSQRSVQAGALHHGVFRRLIEDGRLDPDTVRVLAESAPIPEYMWTFRAGLDDGLREALRYAFFALRDEAALAAYHAEAFIPAVDADVDRVRGWMEEVLQARLMPAQGSHVPRVHLASDAGVVVEWPGQRRRQGGAQ